MILKDFLLENIICRKVESKITMWTWMGKRLWPSSWFKYKRYKEIKKLTTGQAEDYTTGCLLDC